MMSIRPTYSWVAFPTESPRLMEWENSVFNTHQKIKTLYNHTCDVLGDSCINNTKKTLWEIKDTVGLYVIKPIGSSSTGVWKSLFLDDGQWYHSVVGYNNMDRIMGIKEIPNELWHELGFVVLLPSIDTVRWLNKVAKLVDSSYITA